VIVRGDGAFWTIWTQAIRRTRLQVKGRLDLAVSDLGPTQLKNIADPIRVYSLEIGQPTQAKPAATLGHSALHLDGAAHGVDHAAKFDEAAVAGSFYDPSVMRNAGLPAERRIEFRVGIHLGDVVEESDGDLMGDGVNIAARLESIAAPGAICLSEDASMAGCFI
jgi:class 3 adenylate cyclase